MDRLYLNGATLFLAALSSKNSRAYAHINLDNIKKLNMTTWYGSGYTFANFTKDKGWLLNEGNARCTFRGEDCNITADFKHVFTEFGNCYTFNSGDDPSRNLFQDQAGIGNGLRIEINIQQEQYTNLILRGDAPDAGILFHVHNQSEPASVETDGRAVGPGLHAYAGLTRSDFATLHPPYGQCNETASLEFYPVYTMSGCVVECKRKHILRHCNCRLMEHPGNEPVCGLIRILTCVKPLLVNLTQDFTGMCSCSVPCSSVVYQTALSYSLVPSESTKVEASNTLGVAVDDARKNYIILDVYFQSLNYQQSEQLPAVEWTALISDIGGQFGLFMGFSLLTVVEFIEFAIMSVVTLTAAKRSQNKVKGHDAIHGKGDEVPKSSKTGRIGMQGDFVQVHEIF
ncbi:acid-sensing ion channel 2 [Lingula anatina]|uniref:Acid-sensing ion channel 2 n=1 Tax=Lingula anatina TaxID=7574 RepID=A0A1S3IV13_LINAN|nr:acid-sensing ion channel 2 [Lingula anatina]|eukprot:XP_013401781.1 acid-sensing ion channel 2 [Lingula anatina]